MAKYTQEQCTNSILKRRKLDDGSWWIEGHNQEGVYIEFADTVSQSISTTATSLSNAHAFMIANCEYRPAPESQATEPENI